MRNLTLVLVISTCACSNPDLSTRQLTPISFSEEGNISLPHLTSAADGQLYMSWVRKTEDKAALLYSKLDDDGNWTTGTPIASGDNWFVNWADYPHINANKKGELLSHYLAKSSEETFSYDVNVITSPDGKQWTSALVPHKDGTPTEHGFVSSIANNEGSFILSWLDGRNTGGGDHGGHDGHGGGGPMTLRTATISPAGKITDEVELDCRICDCCQTSGAMTNQGPVFVYRDRSENEIRDMAIVRRVNGEWTEPTIIFNDNWKISGCPVNGPRVAANGDNVVVAWFSAPDGKPQIKAIFSSDAGATFGEPIVIDYSKPIGRVAVTIDQNDMAYASWLTNTNGSTSIKAVSLDKSGIIGEPITVAQTDAARSSGFPQMVLHNGALHLAWTDISQDKNSTIRTAKVKL